MRALLREPLFQFLLGGVILFLLLENFAPAPETDGKTIVVDDAALVTYLQFRTKSFNPVLAQETLNRMDTPARAALEEEFLTEEILYREALKLGLDAGDDIIRKRLVQKMNFLLQGFEGDTLPFSNTEVEAYYTNHPDRYHREASASFTHVFLNAETHGDRLEQEATSLLQTLRREGITAQGAGQYGERFLYFKAYADRGRRLIESHFGTAMTDALFEEAPQGRWSGPYISPYGAHLVWLDNVTPAARLSLDDAAQQVVADMQRDRETEALAKAIDRLKTSYSIVKETAQ